MTTDLTKHRGLSPRLAATRLAVPASRSAAAARLTKRRHCPSPDSGPSDGRRSSTSPPHPAAAPRLGRRRRCILPGSDAVPPPEAAPRLTRRRRLATPRDGALPRPAQPPLDDGLATAVTTLRLPDSHPNPTSFFSQSGSAKTGL